MKLPNIAGKDRVKRIETGINHLLDNLDIRSDGNWAEEEESKEQLKALAKEDGEGICDSDQLNLTQPDDKRRILFVGFWGIPDSKPTWQQREKALQEKLTDMAGLKGVRTIQICFLVKSLEERVALEEYFDQKKRAEMRNATGHKKVSLKCDYLLIGECEEAVERLTGIEHYEAINYPSLDRRINIEPGRGRSDNTPPARALVFTLNLYAFAELYNRVGESLFQDNVRFGIQETLGVDRAIQTTLEEEPEEFWFKNNGITILVKGDLNLFSGVTELTLGRVAPDEPLPFSVVNGAQTICASARFFFRNKYRAEHKGDADASKRFERAKTEASVLVRVICVSKNAQTANQLMQEISVALNRQKPIKAEDIAFTTTAAQKLAEYTRSVGLGNSGDHQIFQLIRRGEVPDGSRHCLDLVSFARARMACIGEPHVARSKGANALLKVQAEEKGAFRFASSGLFPAWWNDADDSKVDEHFRQDYNAVWFAHQMAEAYESIRQGWKKPENGEPNQVDQWVALQNGKWYCVAAMVYLLNKGNMSDFTDFSAKSEAYNGQLKEIAECIADLAVFALRKRDAKVMIDSNTFKKQDVHTELIKVLGESQAGDKDARKLLDKLSALIDVSLPLKKPDIEAGESVRKSGGSFVVLEGERVQVKSDVDAFVEIIQYVLNHYSAPDDLSSIDTWLTQDWDRVQKEESFFRSPREVSLAKGPGWVGTSSSAKVKLRQLDCLCRLFQVKGNTLTWHRQNKDGCFWSAPAVEEDG